MNPKIASKLMFIPLKLIIIGFDPSPYGQNGGCTKKNRQKDGKNGGFVTQNGEWAI